MASVTLQNGSDIDYFQTAQKEIQSSIFIRETWPVPAIIGSYLVLTFVDIHFLTKRKPVNLKTLMSIYNIYQIFSNFYMFFQGIRPDSLTYLINHSCHPADPSKNELWLRGSHIARLFFISKLTDLLDTVFIVLRKKRNQISFLHIYHHVGMVIFTWFMLKYYLAEQLVIVILLNSLVHVVMYTYYSISLFGPSAQKYLGWKKYVTILQLSQFVIFITYMGTLLAYGCSQPKSQSFFVLIQGVIFFKLFKDFYDENYSSKSASAVPSTVSVKAKQT